MDSAKEKTSVTLEEFKVKFLVAVEPRMYIKLYFIQGVNGTFGGSWMEKTKAKKGWKSQASFIGLTISIEGEASFILGN